MPVCIVNRRDVNWYIAVNGDDDDEEDQSDTDVWCATDVDDDDDDYDDEINIIKYQQNTNRIYTLSLVVYYLRVKDVWQVQTYITYNSYLFWYHDPKSKQQQNTINSISQHSSSSFGHRPFFN